jgi:hypothetical protein
MPSRDIAKDVNRSQTLVEKLSGPHMFDFRPVAVSSIVLVLSRLTAFSETAPPDLWYAIGALIISQLLAGIFLVGVRTLFLKISQPKWRIDIVVASSLLSYVIWLEALNLILAHWQVASIEYSQWQILAGLIFSSCTVIGLSFAAGLVYEIIELEQIANTTVENLQSSKAKLTQSIKEKRIFILRELALEVQATRESLENTEPSILLNENDVAELKNTLTQVDIASRKSLKNYPHISQLRQPTPQIVYNLKFLISSGPPQHPVLPTTLGIVSLFGMSNWFKYSLDSPQQILRMAILSILGFAFFWSAEKLIVNRVIRLGPWSRVLVFEVFVLLYVFCWIATIGFVAGDQPFGYTLAITSAPIPLVLLNVTAFGTGFIVSSKKYRGVLADLAELLTQELEELETINDRESRTWKSMFGRDLANSPTTASLMMRDAAMIKERREYLETIKNVTNVWRLTLSQLESARAQPEMQQRR